MPPRPKHNDKDLEKLLKEIRDRGWSTERRKKSNYIHIKCSCKGSEHQRWIHATPSDPNYILNVRKWIDRKERECREEEG